MESITSTPKYGQYIDSGYEWIGEIPQHWDLVKLGSCLSPVSVKNCPELPLLSITREQGVIERDVDDQESNHNFIPDDLSGYKKLEKGQFGMNKMKAWQGSYGVSKFTGIVSPAYFVFDFTKAINPEFFNWAIRSKLYVSFFGSASDGVRIGQWDLSKTRMKVIPFVLPSEEEQSLIANFLEKKTTQINDAIAIKEQQISLLKERKQIIIQQAVTQGLDPNVPMKDSGVDWIGEVPEHWGIVPGFTVFKEGKDSNKGMIESQVLSLSYGNIIVKPEEKLVGLVPESFETYQIALPGDIIIRCTDLQNDKTSLRTGIVRNKGIITSAYLNLRLKTEHSAEFMHYFLHVLDITKAIYRFGSGLRQNLSYQDFKHMRILMPPKAEQIEIVNYINNRVEMAESSIDLIKNQIEKLKEYKTTLINSAVTGKIKITPEMIEQ
ncbi:hypothetical protein [Vibrio rotiferianus]|uniref:restriction endonuclease subunit S n=1 Tax=Vibrio rotiferianus TaxID=190895 RepID=UPI0024931368|nr:hypothetical protein [Vibrio rotiferianus]